MTKTSSFAALLLGGLICGGTAFAQTGGEGALTGRLERLEAGVTALGGDIEVAQAWPREEQVAQMPQGLAADFEIRIQALERALSELTGKYEESTHQITQLRDRMERMNSDLEFRLKDIEAGAGGGALAGGGGALPPSSDSALPPSADSALPPEPAAAKPAPAKTQTAAVAAPPANAGPDQQYEHAFALLREEKYADAEKAFLQFLSKNQNHKLAGNAQYWLGESYYVRNKFPEAAGAFAEGLKKYPKNGKAGDNLLKLGMSLQKLNKNKEACTAYSQLLQKFPDASASVKRRADTERKRLNCSA